MSLHNPLNIICKDDVQLSKKGHLNFEFFA